MSKRQIILALIATFGLGAACGYGLAAYELTAPDVKPEPAAHVERKPEESEATRALVREKIETLINNTSWQGDKVHTQVIVTILTGPMDLTKEVYIRDRITEQVDAENKPVKIFCRDIAINSTPLRQGNGLFTKNASANFEHLLDNGNDVLLPNTTHETRCSPKVPPGAAPQPG
jgi:hypothetical protein